jgi:hypothetical protein
MKKISIIALTPWCAALALAACGGGSGLGDDDQPLPDAFVPVIDTPPGVTAVMVPGGDISTDTHWTPDHIYVLEGYVFVTGGTLTIDAGVTVQGKNGSALTITKTAKANIPMARSIVPHTPHSAKPSTRTSVSECPRNV